MVLISFDVRGTFTLQNAGFCKNVVTFGANMSSSICHDNKMKILGKKVNISLEHEFDIEHACNKKLLKP